jgi:uncharacterized protein YdhG (YjbR/CyaY superfamily)
VAGALVPPSVDEYIAGFPPETRRRLQELRSLAHEVAPGVTERISYGMPTFDLAGHVLVYFAGYARHIGLYPVAGPVADALEEELRPFKRGKGSVRLPLDRALPVALVRRIIELRVGQIRGDASR